MLYFNNGCDHSLSKRTLSFSNARFSILEIYERDIPRCFAISHCVSGLHTLPFASVIPQRLQIISRSRSTSSSSINLYNISELIFNSTSFSTLTPPLQKSAIVSALPSLSLSITYAIYAENSRAKDILR